MTTVLSRRARPLCLGFALGFLFLEAIARGQLSDSPVDTPSSAGGDSAQFSQDDTSELLQKASDELRAGKTDAAMIDIDAAIDLEPKKAQLHLFRSLVYARKKLWQRAEDDCRLALKIDPNSPIIQYNMAELKFMQRSYDDAWPGFLHLEGDSNLGDLACYKAYLCDLLAGNHDRANQELAAFNKIRAKPSYFFANAASEMIGGHRSEGMNWLRAAAQDYDSKTINLYFTALMEADSLDAPKVTFTTSDGTDHSNVPAFCEDAGLRVFETGGWTTISYGDLTDDLSGFPAEMQREIIAKKQGLAAPLPGMHQVSFTTRNGRTFNHANALIEGDSLRVQGAAGWQTIPFSQLPADLSVFPDDWQKEILARDETLSLSTPGNNLISFATRLGKKYEQVRVFTGRTGLSVVTADGWETIPFSQLPEDLSVFPKDVRQEIVEWEKAQTPIPPSTVDSGAPLLKETKFPPAWNAASGQPAAFIQVAQDCRFGRCLAVQGKRLVVGCAGATYVYENSDLKARLCPDPDQTGTGNQVRSVAISGNTIVTSTPKGVYVWIETPDGWKLQQQLKIASPATVAIEGDNLAVGVDGKGDGTGPTLFYLRRNGNWQPAKSVDNESGVSRSADLSGRRIALQGNEAVIGLPNWDPGSRDNVGPMYTGHAWVKRRDGDAWQMEAQLAPRDDSPGANQFGANVAFSGDLIAIGCSNRDNNPLPHPGVIYLFRRGYGDWQIDTVLTPPPGAKQGDFGTGAMALSGRTVAVAQMDADAETADIRLSSGEDTGKPGKIRNAGIVYIYEDGKWRAPLKAADPVDNSKRVGSPDNFAASLALDGDTLAVGAPGRQDGTGAVYLWRRQGGQWQPAGELSGFHPDYGLMP